MSFDLEKLQAVAELGEVIRLQNEALERLQAFRKARPYMMMPNLAKMVEENLKENVMVLYKELNNLHKPAEKQTRYICNECHMAFLSPLPGGICDECRARKSSGGPRQYVPYQGEAEKDEELEAAEGQQEPEAGNDAKAEDASSETTADIPDDDDETTAPANADLEKRDASGTGDANSIEALYAAAISENDTAEAEEKSGAGKGSPSEESDQPAEADSAEDAEQDDNYDNPGDEIELANPAPEVAKPEGVEGVPDVDTDGGTTQRRTDSKP